MLGLAFAFAVGPAPAFLAMSLPTIGELVPLPYAPASAALCALVVILSGV